MGSKKNSYFLALFFIFGLIIFMTANNSAGAAFPEKPIAIIVPFTAGGSTDIAVRALAPYLEKYLKTTVVIQNLPGADGAIGYTKGYQAKPDGYTLLASNTLPLILTEFSRETRYKTMDFKPIYAFARDSMILVVHPDFCRSFEEFIKIAKNQTVRIGTTGGATTTGLMGILLAEELGLKINWIPYGGGRESLTALAGKHIDGVFSITASALSLVKAGNIKALAIFAENRNPKFPEVPVPRELGINIPLLFNHTGVVAPPKTPEAIIKILESAFYRAVNDTGYQEWVKKSATSDFVPLNAKEYRKEFERLYNLSERYRKYLR